MRTSSVDKHTSEGEMPVRLCNYVDVYRNDKVGPNPDSMVATATTEEVERFRLQVGDTILTKDSEDPSDIGISAYVEATDRDFVCGYHLAIARPTWTVHPRYLTWALRGTPALHYLSARAAGISRYGLAISDLRGTPIPWCEIEEQRRIADFLDDRVARIDRIIAARREQQRMLARLRGQAVLNDLAGVEVLPLRRVLSNVRTGGTPPTEADSESGLPWYTPGDFDDNLAVGTPSRLVSDVAVTVFPPGSVLLVGIGATVGKVAWIDHDASGNQQITCLVPDAAAMDSRFLLHQLAARAGELRMTAPSATLPIINNETLKSLLIACPLVDEQRRLVREWDHLRDRAGSVVLSVQRSIDLLIEYKQSLITAAVTGELDVTTAGSSVPD